MGDLFGGALTITDNFSNTLAPLLMDYLAQENSFASFTSKIGEAERNNRVVLMNMQREMESYTKFYTSQGFLHA